MNTALEPGGGPQPGGFVPNVCTNFIGDYAYGGYAELAGVPTFLLPWQQAAAQATYTSSTDQVRWQRVAWP